MNVLTYDTPFSFGPLGGTDDLTVHLSYDGARVFVVQLGAPGRVYQYMRTFRVDTPPRLVE